MARIVLATKRGPGGCALRHTASLCGKEPNVQHSIERLSPRQVEILGLVARGLTTRAVALPLRRLLS